MLTSHTAQRKRCSSNDLRYTKTRGYKHTRVSTPKMLLDRQFEPRARLICNPFAAQLRTVSKARFQAPAGLERHFSSAGIPTPGRPAYDSHSACWKSSTTLILNVRAMHSIGSSVMFQPRHSSASIRWWVSSSISPANTAPLWMHVGPTAGWPGGDHIGNLCAD